MQLMPETARELNVTDRRNPSGNVRGGTAYLKQLLDRYAGSSDSLLRALAAYNAGPARVDAYDGLPPYNRNPRVRPPGDRALPGADRTAGRRLTGQIRRATDASEPSAGEEPHPHPAAGGSRHLSQPDGRAWHTGAGTPAAPERISLILAWN